MTKEPPRPKAEGVLSSLSELEGEAARPGVSRDRYLRPPPSSPPSTWPMSSPLPPPLLLEELDPPPPRSPPSRSPIPPPDEELDDDEEDPPPPRSPPSDPRSRHRRRPAPQPQHRKLLLPAASSRRPHGYRRDAHLDGAPIRGAAGESGEKVRLSALRAVWFHAQPGHSQRDQHHHYVFRWLACQFIKGYKEATAPQHNQPELPIKGISEMERKAVNRPVAELPRTAEKEILDVLTNRSSSEGKPHVITNGHGETHADRVQEALGSMFMDITCSNCGSNKVIRAGACGCCTECGTSQGCS